MLTAIIVAAGNSRRLGFDKLTAPLAGATVLIHAVDAFERTASITDILVVGRAGRIAEFKETLANFAKVRGVVAGGEHRHNSVQAGLEQVPESAQFVSVHDAARPLVRPDEIEKVYAQAQIYGAAALAEPMRDTLKRAGNDLIVCESIDRQNVYAMQTPQVFQRKLLEKAYRALASNEQQVTDEVSAVQLLGHQVVLVENSEPNFKITFPRDLELAESVLRDRQGRAQAGDARATFRATI
jgi:2-C-methyl-D-erythritol 4-phosphate cytidylyltransferase